MTSALASAERSKYSHHSVTDPANATTNPAAGLTRPYHA
jgi:hypothetical protein